METVGRDFHEKVFARLDQTEPLNLHETDEAVFVFDAIDATWPGFGAEGTFNLQQPNQVRDTLLQFWTEMFGSKDGRPSETPFDEMPIYRLEVTSRYGDQVLGDFKWIWRGAVDHAELAESGAFPVDVYGGILSVAVEAFLLSAHVTGARQSAALSAGFDVDLWPDAKDSEN